MALGGEDQNISFWCEKARALQWQKISEEEKRRKEKERNKKKSRFGNLYWLVWNFGLEHLFCLEPICMVLLVRKPS